MNHTDWKEEFREYFDKTLKPKKPTMRNLDREVTISFIEKLLLSQKRELAEKLFPEEDGNLTYLSTDVREFARQGREFLLQEEPN